MHTGALRARGCRRNLNYNEIFPNPPQPPEFRQIFPYPNLAAVGILESRAAANYHALTTRLERRYSNGLTFLMNYTFSKTLTDVDASTVGVAIGAGSFGANTIRNLKDNKGPAVFDRPHQLNLSAVYEPPCLRTGPAIARLLLGGWQIAPIWTAYVGAYLTPGNFKCKTRARGLTSCAIPTWAGVNAPSTDGSTPKRFRTPRPAVSGTPARALFRAAA